MSAGSDASEVNACFAAISPDVANFSEDEDGEQLRAAAPALPAVAESDGRGQAGQPKTPRTPGLPRPPSPGAPGTVRAASPPMSTAGLSSLFEINVRDLEVGDVIGSGAFGARPGSQRRGVGVRGARPRPREGLGPG